ncbi:hypothetical protein MBSD_n1930 [Mizugakiibacter sediminis]|uniref:DUF1440 domain-containing protein n=1 Tax=Mizugakiibacter sediminis TaxID=1475481 RepID=A0A0K8QP06_9GAMM|nr:hypothetical protein [Mizugakiibacter sediminis]GAP66619.1 hypothetical protein MBSD_n1930 [Mizugakiibacter sediminis]
MRRHPTPFAILAGGAIAGALDIAFAITFAVLRGGTAMRLLQTIASGLLGAAAYDGGWPTAALGFVLHFAMALLIAAIFCLASRRLPVLTRRAPAAGMLYGFGVFLAMRLVVLPLSAYPHPVTFAPLASALDLGSHMFFVGLPIALAARAAGKPAG